MKKRFAILLLVLCIVISAMPVNAINEEATYVDHVVELPESYTPKPSEYYAKQLTSFQQRFYGAFVSGMTSVADNELEIYQSFSTEYTVTSAPVSTQEELNALVNTELAKLSADLDGQSIYNAMVYDHTELFWLRDAGFKYGLSASTNETATTLVITVTFKVDSSWITSDVSQLRTYAAELTSAINNVLAGAPTSGALDSIEYFNEWLCNNNTYNTPHFENQGGYQYPLAHSAYSAFTSNNVENVGPVCQGYSYALKVLCDRTNIECVVITGTLYQGLTSPGPHAWNAVKLGDAWYAVDATSNDSLSDNTYNFLVGSSSPSHDSAYPTFSASHVNDETFGNYPSLSDVSYNGVFTLAGAHIRVGSNAGLRFGTVVRKDMLFDKYFPTTDDGKTYAYSESANLKFGVLLIPQDLVSGSITEMFEANNAQILDVPAVKIYSQDADSLTFTAVITDIPADRTSYRRSISAVSYIKYRENEESAWNYIYSNELSRSYYNVAKAARETVYSDANNPSPSEEVQNIINQLDDIISESEYLPGWY